MKLVLFGATGGIGGHVMTQALDAGHDVTAVVRRPEAITLRHERLHIVAGNVLDCTSIQAAVAGKDAVISALGTRESGPKTLYSKGIANILDAMKAGGVTRLLCISAQPVVLSPAAPWWRKLVTKYILQRVFKEEYADLRRMEALLNQSPLDWTIIRPPMLTNKSHTGHYQTSINSYLRRSNSISRADAADSLLSNIDNPQTFRAWIEIAN